MSRAVIVPFFRPHPRSNDWYRIMERYFCRHFEIWKSEVDKVIIIDAGWNFDMTPFGNKGEKITVDYMGSHWDNLNNAIPKIKEDYWLLWDCDTVIYQSGVLDSVFTKLESKKYDIVTVLDGSGFLEVDKRYPLFASNVNRATRQRFTPYFFSVANKFFQNIGTFDFTPLPPPKSSDSMGSVTEQLLALHPRIHEIPDDRSSIYVGDDGIFTSPALDSPNYLWSQTCPNSYGYYHMRNWGTGLLLVSSKFHNSSDYINHVNAHPKQELSRLLGWIWTMADDLVIKQTIKEVFSDKGVSSQETEDYLFQFKEFHFLQNISRCKYEETRRNSCSSNPC